MALPIKIPKLASLAISCSFWAWYSLAMLLYLKSTRRTLSKSKVWRSQHKGVSSYGLATENKKYKDPPFEHFPAHFQHDSASLCSDIYKLHDQDSLNPKFEGPSTKPSRVMTLPLKIKNTKIRLLNNFPIILSMMQPRSELISQICWYILIVPSKDSYHSEFQGSSIKRSRVMALPLKMRNTKIGLLSNFLLILSMIQPRYARRFRKYTTGTLQIQSLKVPAQRGPELWPCHWK